VQTQEEVMKKRKKKKKKKKKKRGKKPTQLCSSFLAFPPPWQKFPKRLRAPVEQALLNRRPLAVSQFVAAI
jgi:hypothetical protein